MYHANSSQNFPDFSASCSVSAIPSFPSASPILGIGWIDGIDGIDKYDADSWNFARHSENCETKAHKSKLESVGLRPVVRP